MGRLIPAGTGSLSYRGLTSVTNTVQDSSEAVVDETTV